MTVKSLHGGERSPSMASSTSSDQTMQAANSPSPADCTAQAPVSVQTLTAEEKERVRQRMLERLSTTRAHFAHQQRDAPDLTQQDKVDIAAEILHKNPAAFLARFGKFLQFSDLAFFRDADMDNYEIQFHLKEIQHRCSHSEVIVKNRRYAAMKELEAGGEYFSEEQMKRREPLLFEQMIGQFMTEEELQRQAAEAIDRSDLRFSTILMTHLDDAQQRALYKYQKEKEECQEEEEEEDSEEEEKEDDEDENKQNSKREMEDDDDEDAEDPPEISDARATGIWQQQLREEFEAIMREKFIAGSDTQFDYSKVDDNPDYDMLMTVAQDEEQKYFLSEEPHTVDSDGSNNSRGVADCASSRMEEDEEEDYMMYEPPADLVAKSAQFVKIGTWTNNDDT